jgi:thiol-disulfide isomerase/thioredoxin
VRTPVALGLGAVLAVLLIVAGVLALVGGTSPRAAPKNHLVGKVIPGFSLPSASGSGNVVSPWTNGRPAVVLFFAKWCTICHHEVPTLARAVGRGAVGPVRIIGVDADSELGTAKSFVEASHVHFPVGVDPLEELAAELVPQGLPAAVFVRADGRVAEVQYGALSVFQLSAGLSKLVHVK